MQFPWNTSEERECGFQTNEFLGPVSASHGPVQKHSAMADFPLQEWRKIITSVARGCEYERRSPSRYRSAPGISLALGEELRIPLSSADSLMALQEPHPSFNIFDQLHHPAVTMLTSLPLPPQQLQRGIHSLKFAPPDDHYTFAPIKVRQGFPS